MRPLCIPLVLGLCGLCVACSGPADSRTLGPGLGGDGSTGATSVADGGSTVADSTVADSTVADPTAATGDPTTATTVDPSGSETGPADVSLRRHTLNLGTGQWTSASLDDVWTGPQAAPANGILATASMTNFDRLIVLADDGYTYQLVQGAWLEPLVTDDHFAVLAGREVDALVHVPSPDDPTIETLFLIADHSAVLYDLFDSGNVSFVDDVPLIDEPGGPPHASGRPRWAFTRARPQDLGQIDWLEWFFAYDDDVLYYSDANAQWTAQWPVQDNEFFSGAADEPDPRQASATWYDDATVRLHVLAP